MLKATKLEAEAWGPASVIICLASPVAVLLRFPVLLLFASLVQLSIPSPPLAPIP